MMKLGLVLSGGGVRGIAHIGAIKALEEHDIHPTIVSGSSAGAVVGALYCGGFSTDEMMGFFKLIPLFHLNKFAFKKPGFIDTDKFYADFKKYFREDAFESLEKSLSVTSVDILSGQLKVFEAGELIKPLLASCAFPGLFSPVLHKNVLYADGGILDNFPTIPIKDKCDKLIGVYASPLSAITPDDLKYSVSVLERAIKINYSKRSYLNFRDCDILIRPMKLVKYGLLDVSKMQEIYDIGYDSTNEQLEEISTDDLRRFHS